MIELSKRMYRSALILSHGMTDTKTLSEMYGCCNHTTEKRLKRLRELGVIETEKARNRQGKFSGINILKIHNFKLKEDYST